MDVAAKIDDWVDRNRDEIIGLVQALVRVPSENRGNHGDEQAAQEALHAFCQRRGLPSEMYDIDSVPGFETHALRDKSTQCAGRPNVVIRRPGQRGDVHQSVVLSGHMDVVPSDDHRLWTHPPYAGVIEGDRLYGRGTYDMKAGVAANFAVLFMLDDLGLELAGDLIVESVADEEFAGGHGSIAGRLAGDHADAVLIPEPSNLQVYRAHRGLRMCQLTLEGTGGVTFSGRRPEPAAHHLPALIDGLRDFIEARNNALSVPSCYAHDPSPANWMITKIKANEWAPDALLAVPEKVELELFWEALPGETQAQVESQFEAFLERFRAEHKVALHHKYVLRWMEGFETAAVHPFIRCAETHTQAVTGKQQTAVGAPFPCDMFLFKALGVPAGAIIGPIGANAHAPDEWVDLNSVLDIVRIHGRMVCDWCMRPRPE